MKRSPLDNPIWHSLQSRHKHLALVSGPARRYPPSITPFAAVESTDRQAVTGLDQIVAPGETVGILAVIPPLPWTVQHAITIHQYLLPEGINPDPDPQAVELDESHIPAMLSLTAAVYPHYFRSDTARLGRYVGLWDGPTLCAMAGIRMAMDGYQEISAICTHPSYRGRAYASRLTNHLIHHILAEGDRAFLHTESDNPAQAMYTKLGFQLHQTLPFTVYQK